MEEDHQNPSSSQTIIIAALSSLSPSHLSHLTHHLSSVFHHHSRRVSALLSSPILFSLTLHHLHTLSLHHKSLLISRHLLSNLSLLANYIDGHGSPQPLSAAAMKLRDLDVLLLLLLLCELHQHDPHALDSPPSRWRVELCRHVTKSALSLSNMGVSNCEILIKYVELVAKCRNFVNAMGCGGDGKDGGEVAASVAAVVALPSVEVSASGWECVICKEEMREGRDVCELPCQHLFHWICILPWLRKRNTCPCCRYKLPTDDVSGEIERLWAIFAAKTGGA
nr:E3 ubiquitin-protein ligase SGR9, amyloplastic [Ipomoea trifida]